MDERVRLPWFSYLGLASPLLPHIQNTISSQGVTEEPLLEDDSFDSNKTAHSFGWIEQVQLGFC